MNDPDIDYYEANAARYFRDTVTADLSALRARFLEYLPPDAHVLDAGCGSGRDARAFVEYGCRVMAFDASPALAALAQVHIGQPVRVLRFEDIGWRGAFDGVWACASLLHVPLANLPATLGRLRRSLRAGGVLYASFKHGRGEHIRDGRHFTDLDEAGLHELLGRCPGWQVLDTWSSDDARPGHEQERWFNVLMTAHPAPAGPKPPGQTRDLSGTV
jgi:SAM-dependent methyltransferase